MSIPDMLERIAGYINQFQRHMEELRQRRMQLEEANTATTSATTMISPAINITASDSSLEVNVITGSDMNLALSDIIRIIEEEGAEVLSVLYNNIAGNMIILSIQCQVNDNI